ncbi:AbgT family transporter [Staphylococcus saprophyticus]|uniref:Putative p-aminobenzoyl-glutamate transporter n=1 Tax=Staphylococcus saprophyticus subsp. saprophyticus (strain ATCC 15305 / DSM 20229 / NCIMB 8711 / NCTC 7292 / S-41) TaxID=342451 RepID=Q4A038_STAS1|nr:AbgT family transporter [Staphylococcus saprophyticus]ASF19542.1 aminobenzoyl-glutamate transporter [Staphylococcus saprophyticus]MDW3917364.1 AbgT family transporter [Staphylococcus saprophyticus]OOC97219.1 aminobenzoyl-glutamate transporter [Staphylococcus saprophyticus subsp. saprophyticus ATCC 15305 = NCTC 7292]QCY41729.1 AbgT family transporter [Staphylococcus saprophyticus subsp. saprophyticus ATCC 15305 = NCTC 7292]RTX69972.1 AbgT family transporter [Staphylococcus saprophyticus]
MTSNTKHKPTLVDRFLNIVEKVGNKLPDPSILFFLMCLGLAIITWIVSLFHITVKHPGTGDTIAIKSILSKDGLMMILNDAVKNFSEFPALGLVLAVMLGVGVAEKTGYFDKLMVQVVHKAPKKFIVPVIILIGILGNAAGDAAPIVLPPLTAMVFIKLGYHPIAGLAMAYASAIGGFSANIMIGMSDALLYAFTEPATKIVSDNVHVNVAMNWYFIAASVLVLLPAVYWVTMRFVIPRLGSYDDSNSDIQVDDENTGLTTEENRAVFWANISFFIMVALLIILAIPQGSFLRNAKTGSLLNDAPIINGVGLIILVLFLVPGLVYGLMMKEFKNSKDLGKMLADSMSSMGSFIVIVFFAAQLLAFLEWSNLGVIVAVKGAALLQGQNGIILILGIILLSVIINLLIGSASAKWGILASIFIPMLMLVGFHPAFTQMLYRIGDSISNPITPMMPYLPLLLSYAQKYDNNMKLGSLLSSLMPYTIVLSIVWPLFMIIWYLLGWPLGPGGPLQVK